MRKFRKFAAMSLVAAMTAATLAGCGSSSSSSSSANGDASKPTEAPAAGNDETPAGGETEKVDYSYTGEGEGKVLNIYCWNNEFASRMAAHYPGYEKVDDVTGKIGDVEVRFNITPNDNNGYQNALDNALELQADAAADEKIDIFLVEADYATKYTAQDCSMPVTDLGITDDDLANQYQYTKDVVTYDGVLKGVSWQACPGVLIYNNKIATEVLGSDEPDKVQEAVKDWATFKDTAAKMKEKGYYMTAGYEDTYRVFSNNVTSKWVEDGKINLDDNIKTWIEQTKEFADNGYTAGLKLWDASWSAKMAKDQDVFCFFGPAWFVDYCFAIPVKDAEGNNVDGEWENADSWKVTTGPQGYFWGGTWICAATGTDNQTLVKNIMLALTTDEDIMIDIVKDDNDFVNNKPAMNKMAAADSDYVSKFLCGMNPLPYYCAGVEKIDLSKISPYDQGCNEEIQNHMKDYFIGESTYDEAYAAFEKAVIEKYPELGE